MNLGAKCNGFEDFCLPSLISYVPLCFIRVGSPLLLGSVVIGMLLLWKIAVVICKFLARGSG